MDIKAVLSNAELQKIIVAHIEDETGKFVKGDVQLVRVAGTLPIPGAPYASDRYEAICILVETESEANPPLVVGGAGFGGIASAPIFNGDPNARPL